MERRILVLKSAESRLENGFLETIEEKYIQCIQTCSLGMSMVYVQDVSKFTLYYIEIDQASCTY